MWDLTIDGPALARHLGDAPPDDAVAYVHHVIALSDPVARRAFEAVAAALGRGIGGLVNLHDPEVMTLGGVWRLMGSRAGAFDSAYRDGLMAFRKGSAPRVCDGVHTAKKVRLRGAVAWRLTTSPAPAGLADWAQRQSG